MTIDPEPQHANAPGKPDKNRIPVDENTMDLTGFDDESLDDLQAFADQVAEVTPDPEILGANPAALTAARARVAELEQKAKEDHERHLRLLSDFTNFRNRTQREIQLAVDLSEKRILMEIVPVLDNFERCLASSYLSVEDFRSGVELIRKQFLDHLRRLGVEMIEIRVGEPFDARLAEALTTRSDESLPDGSVAEVFEKGFKLRDLLMRPARVVVNHNPGAQEPVAPEDGSMN